MKKGKAGGNMEEVRRGRDGGREGEEMGKEEGKENRNGRIEKQGEGEMKKGKEG